jgi:hypothetical protein
MFEFSEMTTLEIWHSHVTVESSLESFSNPRRHKKLLAEIGRNVAKSGQGSVGALINSTNGTLRFIDRPPHIVRLPEDEVESVILPAFERYISSLSDEHRSLLDHYRYVDSARSLGGISHIGIRRYVVALAGNDESDLLMLVVSEGVSSVMAQYVPSFKYRNEAERVVQGQRLTQAATDPFLGWGRDSLGRDYYFQRLLEIKLSSDLAPMKASIFKQYASLCGGVLARAHARSGDPISISAYLGKNEQFDEAVARFAMRYADQIEVDHAALIAAVQSGRVVAEAPD